MSIQSSTSSPNSPSSLPPSLIVSGEDSQSGNFIAPAGQTLHLLGQTFMQQRDVTRTGDSQRPNYSASILTQMTPLLANSADKLEQIATASNSIGLTNMVA